MTTYSAKVVVEYYFDFDSEDTGVETLKEAEDYAWLHYEDYPYSAEVYSIDVEEEPEDDEEEVED